MRAPVLRRRTAQPARLPVGQGGCLQRNMV